MDRRVNGPELRTRIGRRIAFLRRSTRPRLNQEALARRIGVSVSYLSKLEAGSKELPLTLAARIASALSVPLAELLIDVDSRHTEDCHRFSLRLCQMIQDSECPLPVAEQVIETILKTIVTLAPARRK